MTLRNSEIKGNALCVLTTKLVRNYYVLEKVRNYYVLENTTC